MPDIRHARPSPQQSKGSIIPPTVRCPHVTVAVAAPSNKSRPDKPWLLLDEPTPLAHGLGINQRKKSYGLELLAAFLLETWKSFRKGQR
ncbi:hypothetical protein NPIL_698821 [Nephila pilipes]|uniref:Uncharacterized protein n=1 Tax=Nephila pilipes TaxID=299642 RepID=A0A8X6PL48_NEPPI|nr:hypothetical protein NPIL_698821 [Nephila pilipes]